MYLVWVKLKLNENQEIISEYGWAEKTYYPEVIMDNIKTFYDTISKEESRQRDEKLVSEINKMMKQIEIFEEQEIIEKEFKEIQEFLQDKKVISYALFIELLHKLAVVCQRIWYHKGLLLTPVPYKENIYKDILEEWISFYPDKFPEYYEDQVI